MESPTKKTFKTALRQTRKDQSVSLQELGARIDSDASHIFKIEHGQDIALSTLLRLAAALDVDVKFGAATLRLDSDMKKRLRKNSGR